MKKNPRDYVQNGKMYAYILDSIDFADKDTKNMSDKERIKNVLDIFYEENSEDILKEEPILELLSDWLRRDGTVDVAEERNEIAELGTKWGYCRTDARTSLFVRTWYKRVANSILRLAKLYGVDTRRIYNDYTYKTVQELRDVFLEYCKKQRIMIVTDVELREMFFDFTDTLRNNGEISDHLCDTAVL